MPKTILAVIDPTQSGAHPVLDRVAWLAQRVGATLELFTCDYDVDIDAGQAAAVWTPETDVRARMLLRHRQTLEELAAPLRARGLSVTTDVAWDCPLGEAIVRKVEASEPWLVAKDTHHHNIVQRTLFTSADWHLITHCPAPLLLVKPRVIGEHPNVLAAVDPLHYHDKPAELDDAIFGFAEALASSTDGTLHVVHSAATPMGIELPPEVREVVLREHRDAMAWFLGTHKLPSENVHLLEGVAHECLQAAATQYAADFVVMGAVARRGLGKLFIGSTATRVLDRLPCDLVIIKLPASGSERRQ